MKAAHVLTALGMLLYLASPAQKRMIDSSLTIPMIGVSYGMQFPHADMGKRFGMYSGIGGQFGLKLKSRVYLGLKIHYIFGGNVKEDNILDNIRTSEGGIIEVGGELTDPILEMTGYSAFVSGGYLFPVIGPNPNSGILVTSGFGILQHRIKIDYRDAQIPQLNETYRKGYDRLTNGFAMNQFIGYMHFGRRKLINFYAGIEFTEAWTKNRRGYNFDQMRYDNTLRFDSSFGLRVGWMIALYRRAPEQFYFY